MKSHTHGRGAAVVVAMVLLAVGAMSVSACTSKTPTSSSDQAPPSTTAPSSPATTPATETIDAEAIVSGQCGLCHPLSRIYLQPDATDWAAVLDRMDVNHSNASPTGGATWQDLTPERKAAIVEFLKTRTLAEGELVVRDKCTKCHELSNITKQAVGADWSAIVDRMIKKHGAKLSVSEQQSAVNFLQGDQ